jgi:hypothetical protein
LLTPKSPDFSGRTSFFCPEWRLRSRRLLELGGSGHEAAAFLPGGGVFQRGRQLELAANLGSAGLVNSGFIWRQAGRAGR